MKSSNQEEYCQRLILAIAETAEVPPTDLPPLGYAIDSEALQAFLSSSGDAEVEFQYFGQRIRLTADGRISMRDSKNEQARYVARCNTCGEENREVMLETAQDFFAIHADQRHAVEMFRRGETEPGPPEDTSIAESGQPKGTD